MSNLNNNIPPYQQQQQQFPQQGYPYMQQQAGFPQPGMNMAGSQPQMGSLPMQQQANGQQPIQQFAQQPTQQIAQQQQQQPPQMLPQQHQQAPIQPPAASKKQQGELPADKDSKQLASYGDEGPDGEGNDENKDDQYEEVRGRRRSKNDVEGRDHKCKYCDKTYLSYPALYTHTKQKHSTGPDGEQRAPPTSGRGRGRPRKNTNQRTDPKSEDYFYACERKGGPVDPVLHFDELYELIIKDKYESQSLESYPLYRELLKFSRDDKSQYQTMDDPQLHIQLQERDDRDEDPLPYEPRKLKPDGKTWQQREWRHDFDAHLNIDEQTRNQMLIDETFAVYLYKISLKTNPVFYKVALSFVIFFRECLNHIGWTKRIQSDEIDLSKHPDIQQKMKTTQFCLANTAEHAPEICNEFVTVYMEDNRSVSNIDRTDSIDLTINLCHWLFENQFTCSKLTMIQ